LAAHSLTPLGLGVSIVGGHVSRGLRSAATADWDYLRIRNKNNEPRNCPFLGFKYQGLAPIINANS
jgi:hypothetical protein